jgi:predicted membrane metal-binding protein
MPVKPNFHERFNRLEAPRGSSDRSFGFIFSLVATLIAVWPSLQARPIRWWVLVVAGVLAALASWRPSVLHPANRLWTIFGLFLNSIVSPLIMGLVFFLVVTPTGVLMRRLGKDILRLHFDPRAASYWIERTPPGPAPDTMSRQF